MTTETSVTIITCTVIACLFAAIMHGCHEVETTQREAMKAGLVQKSYPAATNWEKP